MSRFHTTARFLTAALAAIVLSACTEPSPYDLRRVPFPGQPTETLEAGGVARPGQRVGEGALPSSVALTQLTAGQITLFVAPSEEATSGGVEVELREAGWRSFVGAGLRERCSLRWGQPGDPGGVPWHRCSFDLDRPVESARLEVTRRAGMKGDVFLSELRVEGQAERQQPHVFVLLLDALRFDGMRPFNPDAHVGHHMERLARDSVVLRNLRSSSSWTRPAVATLFTGLRVDRHRIRDRGDVLSEEATTIAELMRNAGYSTAAWSTNPNVLPVWGLAQGFDAFVDQGSQSWGAHKTDGAKVISRMRAALADRGNEPLFHYAHFMDPHAPYLPNERQKKTVSTFRDFHDSFPRPLRIFSAPADWQAFLDYSGELVDTDEHIGAFVDVLEQAGLYEDSLLLVVVDHGEEFLDHGGRDHGRTLYEEMLRVPALIKLPGNRFAGETRDELLSFVDLLPTLLETLEIALPAGLDGAPIPIGRDAHASRPHVAQLGLDGRRFSSIIDPPWKLIRNDSTQTSELYDLAKDPRERSNVVAGHPEEATRLARAMDLIMSHGQEGWHFLLCGSLESETLDFSIGLSTGTLETFGLEESEVTMLTAGEMPRTWRLRPRLAPVSVQRPQAGKLITVSEPEQAELLVARSTPSMDESVTIWSESGAPFKYRLGASNVERSTNRLNLNPDSAEAVISDRSKVECATATDSRAVPAWPSDPFFRVWFVPPPAKVAVEMLDPAMQERLRALGYLQ